MSLRINDLIPNFKANTDKGIIIFHDWIGTEWAILFSHPKDFTPVCTTEFGVVAKLAKEWKKRHTKVIGLSVDSVNSHEKWKYDIENFCGTTANFPIIADEHLVISKALGMLPADAYLPDGRTAADAASVRSVFIIGPDKKLKLSMTYPMSVGRNFAEVLRVLDALQLTYNAPLATPADWFFGQDVIVALSLCDEEARKKYGSIDIRLPYLRFIDTPM